MKTIYKYPIQEIHRRFSLDMHQGSELVLCDLQEINCGLGRKDLIPTMWFLVNTENKIEKRDFFVVGTGHAIDEDLNLKHFYSYQQGDFVWHIFEIIK